MAMVICRECKNKVSNKAEKCPSCGVRIQSGVNIVRVLLMVGWIIIACPLMFVFLGPFAALGIGLIGFIVLAIAK